MAYNPYTGEDDTQPINLANNLNNQMAKVYDKNALIGAGGDWAGYGFGANDELEAMENYYQEAQGLREGKLGKGKTPGQLRTWMERQQNIPFGGGLKSRDINMDLVPADFLQNEQDFRDQKSPYDLIKGDQSSLTNDQYLDQNNLYADAGTFMNDAMFSGIGKEMPKFFEAQANERLDLNDPELTTNINELPQTFDAFQDAQDKGYGQFFRNQPVDESTQWFREPTGARMISNPDFPVNKENLGGILEYAKGKGIQGKDLLMAGLGKALNFPIGLASMLGGSPDNPYQKFQKDMFSEAGYGGDANKDPWGKNVRSFADTYDVTDQWDKFAGSVLGQKYGLEAFGKDGLTDEEIAQLEKMGLKGYQLNRARGLSKFNQKALAWKKQKVAQKKTLQDHQQREARQAVLDQRQAAADRSRAQTGQTTSGGAGHYDASKDHSRPGGYGGTGRASDEARSQDLGFSDIRLKDNIELMGQSPSNINIYKFNYLNDPTVYQGVMAQEVPWASVTADNGYLMVDYNKVDVEFKKWPR